MKLSTNTVIIGSGIAGMTAAIYLKRSNIDVILIEKSAPGGQINRSPKIENYPGFKEIDGPTLSLTVFDQIKNLNVDYRYGNVLEVKNYDSHKIIKTDIEEISCQNIIIATGRKSKELGLVNEKQLIGRGISWCAICDGIFYKDKIVAVVGGGNSALEEALYLSTICQKVYLIHRKTEFRAEDKMIFEIKNKSNIETIYDSNITKINASDNQLVSIIINNSKVLEISGLFISIGYEPETGVFKELVDLDNGYIIVDSKMQTKNKNIYACGDVIKKDLYQLTTASAEGAIAANTIKKTV